MGTIKLRNFSHVIFYLLALFTCYNVSATSTQDGIFDFDICKIAYCGKGTCHSSETELLGFRCDCDSGWKKINVNSIELPPCMLPNCTINLGCDKASLPTPPVNRPDGSNPCLINLCGDGNCVTTSGSDFKCECNEGSANLLNDPKMICLKKCSLGGDCNGLDLGGFFTPPVAGTQPATPNSTTSSSPGKDHSTTSSSPETGSGEMLNCSSGLYMLTVMILATIIQIWI